MSMWEADSRDGHQKAVVTGGLPASPERKACPFPSPVSPSLFFCPSKRNATLSLNRQSIHFFKCHLSSFVCETNKIIHNLLLTVKYRNCLSEKRVSRKWLEGLPWWSNKNPRAQCRGCRFSPWLRSWDTACSGAFKPACHERACTLQPQLTQPSKFFFSSA